MLPDSHKTRVLPSTSTPQMCDSARRLKEGCHSLCRGGRLDDTNRQVITMSQSTPRRSSSWPSVLLIGVGLYSALLIGVELMTSQAFVRHFVTDITGPVPFYAVNTSLSVFLLWATALLFVVASAVPSVSRFSAPTWWIFSQAAVFAYLGADDRFLIHETVSRLLRIGDHFILIGVAGIEVPLLAYGMRRGWMPVSATRTLGIAAVLFAAMLGVDALAPHDLRLRLSVEDVLKTWSCLFFLRFAWLVLFARIDALAKSSSDEDSTTLTRCFTDKPSVGQPAADRSSESPVDHTVDQATCVPPVVGIEIDDIARLHEDGLVGVVAGGDQIDPNQHR